MFPFMILHDFFLNDNLDAIKTNEILNGFEALTTLKESEKKFNLDLQNNVDAFIKDVFGALGHNQKKSPECNHSMPC